MNLYRAVLSVGISRGQIPVLVARGIEAEHFLAAIDEGEELAEVYEWAKEHVRRYNVSPSAQMVKERFPEWRGEPSSDPTEALIDQFFANLTRYRFEQKLVELAKASNNPKNWPALGKMLSKAGREIEATANTSRRQGRLSEMPSRVTQYRQDIEEGYTPGIRLGLESFDEMIGGVRPGDIVVLSGFLGTGKTTLAAIVSLSVRDQGHNVLFIPLEMSHEQTLERMDTMVVNFEHKKLRRRQLSDRDFEDWKRTAVQYSKLDADIYVRELNPSVDQIQAEIERVKPKLVVVDYIQLIDQSWEGLVQTANQFKQIALATQTVIVIVSQDNRSAAEGGSQIVTAGGSIGIPQVADVYIGMHQSDEMYDQHRMRLKLLKVRSGARNKNVDWHWNPARGTFYEIKHDEHGHPPLKAVG